MIVRWMQPAADDLNHIADYTDEHFGAERARKTAIAIWDGADSLGTRPHLGRPGRKRNTRELVIADLPFLIIYRLRGQAVEILRILHGAQKWP
jgi:toxin ParE1/3/4